MTPNLNPSPELKPCPFGHEFEAKYPPAPVQRMSWHKGLSEERCRVMCKCGAQGPIAEGSHAAIAAWNTRALSPQTLPAPGEVGRNDAEVIAEFAFLYRAYGIEDDAKLAPDALELKRKVLAALTPTLATVAAANDEGVAK